MPDEQFVRKAYEGVPLRAGSYVLMGEVAG
jgi:hypothetical protein